VSSGAIPMTGGNCALRIVASAVAAREETSFSAEKLPGGFISLDRQASWQLSGPEKRREEYHSILGLGKSLYYPVSSSCSLSPATTIN